METVKQVLMRRDGMSSEEADDLIEEASNEISAILANDGTLDEVEEVVCRYFGLELDYVVELLP
jgi:hypothetical protein